MPLVGDIENGIYRQPTEGSPRSRERQEQKAKAENEQTNKKVAAIAAKDKETKSK